MNIRLARLEDSSAMVEFNQAMAEETEGKTLDRDVLTSGVEAVFSHEDRGFYVVAELDGRIVAGLMVTYEWSDWRDGWFWWIQSVYVLPYYRGRGIYGMLYDFVKDLAGERGGVCGFRLYVEKENVRAQKVYENLGMEETYYLMYEEKVDRKE